ncbi:MAG: serine/threonine-protein kinase, partial [Cyanobacteria bacterium J06648_11]
MSNCSVLHRIVQFRSGIRRHELAGTEELRDVDHRQVMIVIPGYQVVEVIHESADVLVVRGLREQDNLPAILKVLPQESATPLELARFQREFSLVRDLNLPCVTVYELVECGDTLAIAMEDCQGIPLSTYLARHGALPVARALEVAIAVTAGLVELHAVDVIHKDLNPSNILLARGQLHDIRIIDFGLAERGEIVPAAERLDRLEGTLAYLSPEQTGRIASPLDRRTDLYALGVTLYELLAGHLPFQESDDLAWVHAHLAKQAVPLHASDPEIPEPLGALVAKLMTKSADDRYQTARGVLADLEMCRQQWSETGWIGPFPLARSDSPGQLTLPQKVFGRDAELAVLRDAFERATTGRSTSVWISGRAGAGKSTLVRSLFEHRSVRTSLRIAGKF